MKPKSKSKTKPNLKPILNTLNRLDSIDYNNGNLDSNNTWRKIGRIIDNDNRHWLVMDNAHDEVNIEMKLLNLISNDTNEHDDTLKRDIITKLFDNIKSLGIIHTNELESQTLKLSIEIMLSSTRLKTI